MTYDSQTHHRRSIRLRGYDYQDGAYYITICVQDRACLFGEVVGSEMHLNDAGRMILAEWNTLPVRFPIVELDAFVIMPNHIHGIITLSPAGRSAAPLPAVVARPRATTRVAPTPTIDAERITTDTVVTERSTMATGSTATPQPALGDVVGAFKSLATNLYISGVKQSGWPTFRGRLWQRNYHEHIIRDGESLNRIRQYILENPANWATDEENPLAGRPRMV